MIFVMFHGRKWRQGFWLVQKSAKLLSFFDFQAVTLVMDHNLLYGVTNVYDPWFCSDSWVEYYFVYQFHFRIFVSLHLKHSLSGSEHFATPDNSKCVFIHNALGPILLVYFSFQIKSNKKPIPIAFFRHIFNGFLTWSVRILSRLAAY